MILDKTRDIVVTEFEKSKDDVKDGMDIALCSLNGNKLEYAGAHNPLWIVRDGEVLETKADKQPIGKFEGAQKADRVAPNFYEELGARRNESEEKDNSVDDDEMYDHDTGNSYANDQRIKKDDEDTAHAAVATATEAKEKAVLHSDAFKKFHAQIKGWLARSDGIISHILPSS